MSRSSQSWIARSHWLSRIVFAVGDYAAIVAAEFVALFLRNFFFTYSVYHIAPVYFWLIAPFIFMIFLFTQGLYHRKLVFYQAVEKIFYSCLYGTLFSVVLLFIGKVSAEVSRAYVLIFTVFCFCFLVLVRYILKKTLGKSSVMQTPVLIVGAGVTADVVIKEFEKDSGLNYRVIGFLEDHVPKTAYAEKYPVLGGFDDLEKIVRETGVQHILIAAPGLAQKRLSELLYRAQSICSDVGVVPNLVEVPMANVEVESYYDAKVMILHVQNNLASRWNRWIKYVFEGIASLIGVICISPLLAYIAIRIRKNSPGPIIYAGERIGQNGRRFKCYKFRSMYVNSDEILQKYLLEHPDKEEEWKIYHKLKDKDPRVTPVGHMSVSYTHLRAHETL